MTTAAIARTALIRSADEHRDRAARATDAAERRVLLRKARDRYAEAGCTGFARTLGRHLERMG